MLEDILATIGACPRLRDFSASVCDLGVDLRVPDTLIESLTLETFALTYSHGLLSPFRVLDFVSLPALQRLSIFGGPYPNEDDPDPAGSAGFQRFFATTNTLTSLGFELTVLTKDALLELGRAIPSSVRRLNLHCATHDGRRQPIDDDFLALLASAASESRIEDLVIRNAVEITDEALCDFITTKMNSEHPLKRVRVKVHRPKGLDVVSRVESFIEAGLQLTLQYMDPIVFSASDSQIWQADSAHEWYNDT
jgi:hypothetical protein